MMEENPKEFESKLIPIMREGIEVVKMACFQKIASSLADRHSDMDKKFLTMLTGAVINKIFGTPNLQEPFASFAAENLELIDEEVNGFADNCEEMRIPLTDALRMQAICDRIEEIADDGSLKIAKEAGILIDERDLPLPHSFIEMVRRIGKALGLIIPPLPSEGNP